MCAREAVPELAPALGTCASCGTGIRIGIGAGAALAMRLGWADAVAVVLEADRKRFSATFW